MPSPILKPGAKSAARRFLFYPAKTAAGNYAGGKSNPITSPKIYWRLPKLSKKKVLVVHASAGAGHKKAAEAVYNALKESGHYEAHFADVLDYTNPFYKYSYQKTYTYLVTKTPLIWALFFKLTDLKILRPLVRVLRRILNSVNAKTFEKFLKKEQFDCIVSTHFFPNEVASSLKR